MVHQATMDKASRLPAQLCRMEICATAALRAAEESAAETMKQLLDFGLTEAEVTPFADTNLSIWSANVELCRKVTSFA